MSRDPVNAKGHPLKYFGNTTVEEKSVDLTHKQWDTVKYWIYDRPHEVTDTSYNFKDHLLPAGWIKLQSRKDPSKYYYSGPKGQSQLNKPEDNEADHSFDGEFYKPTGTENGVEYWNTDSAGNPLLAGWKRIRSEKAKNR